MAFIPKIISFDSGGAGYPKTYDALYDSKKLDNIVKEYITLNPNHEFVQYLFAIDRYENEDDIDNNNEYKIFGFVVKVPYDIDTDKIAELTTPLVDGYTELTDNSKGGTKRRKRGRKRGTKRRS
jgi:hypothetical protein